MLSLRLSFITFETFQWRFSTLLNNLCDFNMIHVENICIYSCVKKFSFSIKMSKKRNNSKIKKKNFVSLLLKILQSTTRKILYKTSCKYSETINFTCLIRHTIRISCINILQYKKNTIKTRERFIKAWEIFIFYIIKKLWKNLE